MIMLSALGLTAMPQMACSQCVYFGEDDAMRGYYDRSWQRYEAEPGLCDARGEFLLPPSPYTQLPLQAEASRQTAFTMHDTGDYVSWTVDNPGRGVTIRFSLPDSADGKGEKSVIRLSVNDGRKPVELTLDSFWAWQYTVIAHANEKYPDNTPSDDKFARMRFDETTLLLDDDVPSGAVITLAKVADDGLPVTIDFLELEPVAPPLGFEDIETSDKVMFEGGSLGSFIADNGGKTIYVPAGTYKETRPITITVPGTEIIGAGMWHTNVMFTSSSDNRDTYAARGFHCNQSNVVLKGMSINTMNNKRYYNNNPSFQVGKGLNGSWGRDSRVEDVRIDHFECGAWITGADRLVVTHCRMRNNYADGINLAGNSSNCIVSHCSFRNNGDDDMASWSTGDFAANNEYSYNTAENNWRASSLGFFGGRRHKAHHIAVYDAMEAGVRVTCDFPGTGFGDDGEITLSDITIRRCGALKGTPGEQGGFWGGADAALEFRAGYAYDLKNISACGIDIHDSRGDAVSIEAQSGKLVNGLELHDILIDGVGQYAWGIRISPSVRGYGHFSDIVAKGVQDPYMSTIPEGFDFTDIRNCVDCIPQEKQALFFDLRGVPVSPDECCRGVLIRSVSGKPGRCIMR